MVDAITIATYTGPGDDPSELYVELANPAYLEASRRPAPDSIARSEALSHHFPFRRPRARSPGR
jgi:hypothetical protein